MKESTNSFISFIKCPMGFIEIETDEDAVLAVKFHDEESKSSSEKPAILLEAEIQLKAFFAGKLQEFELKLNPQGTEFQKRVWTELVKIPFGKRVTYLDMANRLGDPKVIRAAASANGKNPIAIIIPCHRVIGSDGSLTGYASGLPRKKMLLDHEDKLANGVLELF